MEIKNMILCKEVRTDMRGNYQPIEPIYRIQEVLYPAILEKCSLIVEANSENPSKVSVIIDSPNEIITEQEIDVVPDVEGRWVKIITLNGLPLGGIGFYNIKIRSERKVLKELGFKAEYIAGRKFSTEDKSRILSDPALISDAGRTILSGVTKKSYNIYLSLDETKEAPIGYIKMPLSNILVEDNGNKIDLTGLRREMESKFGDAKKTSTNGLEITFLD